MAVAGIFDRFHDPELAMIEFGLDVIDQLQEFNRKHNNANLQVRVGVRLVVVVEYCG